MQETRKQLSRIRKATLHFSSAQQNAEHSSMCLTTPLSVKFPDLIPPRSVTLYMVLLTLYLSHASRLGFSAPGRGSARVKKNKVVCTNYRCMRKEDWVALVKSRVFSLAFSQALSNLRVQLLFMFARSMWAISVLLNEFRSSHRNPRLKS